jgi:chaperonin cofactor prefoldin
VPIRLTSAAGPLAVLEQRCDDDDDDTSFQNSAGSLPLSLYEETVALLESEDVSLKPSTKIQLRHILEMRVDVYEAKQRRYEETLARLREEIAAR